MSSVVNVNDLLDGHVGLEVECLDRLYLNGYVPKLQVRRSGRAFLKEHLGMPIPSPAMFNKIGTAFRRAVSEFAETNDIPLMRFKKGDRGIDLMRPYLTRRSAPAVVAIGVAQEFQWVFTGYERPTANPAAVCYGFAKAERRVSVLLLLRCSTPSSVPGSSRSAPTSRCATRRHTTGWDGRTHLRPVAAGR